MGLSPFLVEPSATRVLAGSGSTSLLRKPRPLTPSFEFDPRGRVIARSVPPPDVPFHSCIYKAPSAPPGRQLVVDAKPRNSAGCVSEVVPERVDALTRMPLSDCIGPTLIYKLAIGFSHPWQKK